ncbi:MAG: hypothetical protein ACHQIL_02795 [Steroidobacterales bacterium]
MGPEPQRVAGTGKTRIAGIQVAVGQVDEPSPHQPEARNPGAPMQIITDRLQVTGGELPFRLNGG